MNGLISLLAALSLPTLAEEPAKPEAGEPAAPPSAEPPPAPEPPPSQERLPAVISVPPALYPPDALAAGREAAVLLQLSLDAEGRVLGALVLEPAGEGFDEAAREAMLGARFTPALDAAGQPVPALINYRYRFTVATAPKLSLEGTIRSSVGAPLAERPLRVRGPDGSFRYASTDAEGRFRFAGLPDGRWTLVFEDELFELTTADVDVVAGQVGVVEITARPKVVERASGPGEELIVEAERIRPEVSERRLEAADIEFLPGTNGDVVKVVQNLPGVARAPLGTGALIIRGAAPEDSAAFVDGARIPVVFHFSGLTTILSGDLLDEVAFVPGNASVRYGRFLAGMVELRTHADAPAEPGGHVSVDLYQAAAFVEQPVGAHSGITLSLRRSYADTVLVPVLNALPDLSIRAPRYFDAQARGQTKLGRTKLDTLFLFSDDRFALLDGDDEETAAVQIGLSTQFWRARATASTELGGGWQNELNLGGGTDVQAFTFDVTGEAEETNAVLTLREELSRPVSDTRPLGWRFGLDLEAGPQGFLYDVESFGPREEGSALRVAPAAYAESTVQIGHLRLIPGLRADALILDTEYAKLALDPRFSARWAITDDTALRLGVGRYSQFPTVRQLLPDGDGNPELGPAWALQSSLGLDQRVFDGLTVETTIFYNHLQDLVVGREDRLRFFSGPPLSGPQDDGPYANDGVGRVCGGELLARLALEDTLALLSVTVSNSARVKRPGEEEALFEYDQPVVLNLLGSQALPRDWRLGGRLRFSSGNPSTPVVNRVYDMGSRSFIPIYGERDSDRLPSFFSVDIRVDKTYRPRWGEIGVYLDVQNATNAKNVEVMNWTYDYSEEDPVAGLPLFPTFGVEARW